MKDLEELEDARADPQQYGLDADGWPTAEEFNAIMWSGSSLEIDDC
jgi:hypothetical protein